MFFPIAKVASRWTAKDPNDLVKVIDRELAYRSYRLAIGISLNQQMDRLRGALIVSQGRGKYLRMTKIVCHDMGLESAITHELVKQSRARELSLADLATVQMDLSRRQCALAGQLKQQAGKFVDRLLFIAASDPGIWFREQDGRNVYQSLTPCGLLAELSGTTVIDSFPEKDLFADGSGKSLEALPAWLTFADRARTIARQFTIVLDIDTETTGYLLPPSDGLDACLPDIRVFRHWGMNLIESLERVFDVESRRVGNLNTSPSKLSVDGKYLPELANALSEYGREHNPENLVSVPLNENSSIPADTHHHRRFCEDIRRRIISNRWTLADCVRTAVVLIIDDILASTRQFVDDSIQPVHIILSAGKDWEPVFLNQISRVWPGAEVQSANDYGIEQQCLSGVLTGVLGLMFVDQMPANIPAITGASCQRILGRVTPGNPANWRFLLQEMADFQPSAIRLRDAV
jgi:1,6-anhydro-N-acetylmuramate kinase